MRLIPIWIITIVSLVIAPTLVSAYTTSLLMAILMYAALAQSWTMFSGSTGYISLATSAFFGLGAYVTALLDGRFPLPVAMMIAALINFVLVFAVASAGLRLKGPYFAILTFGLSELMAHSALWLELEMFGTRGRMLMPVKPEVVYYSLLVIALVVFLTAYFVKRSRFGLALRSIGQDEERAETLGINTTFIKLIGFALSAALIGAVGAAVTPRWTYLDPYIAFNALITFQTIIMSRVGGMGSLYGPLLGAAVLASLSELFLTRFPYHYMIMLGTVLIVIILFLPDGLSGLIEMLLRKNNAATGMREAEHA